RIIFFLGPGRSGRTPLKHTSLVSAVIALFCCFSARASTDFVVPPGAEDLPLGITLGPDSNLWFANEGGRTIARINPGAGTITTFVVPNGIDPRYIVAGPDGNLWFNDLGGDFIGKVTTGGSFTEYLLTAGSQPAD